MRSYPLAAVLGLVGALTATTVVLVILIERVTGQASHEYLLWNLFLAWLPLAFALMLERRRSRGSSGPGSILLAAAWLLFLPNAPYIVTDMIHLGRRNDSLTVWVDFTTLATGAAAGAAAGFVSLLLVQRTVLAELGPRVAWALVIATMALASFGIYLGRVARLNSWDVVARPRVLVDVVVERLEDPLAYPRMVAGVLAVTLALVAAYVVFYRLTVALEGTGRRGRSDGVLRAPRC